MTKLDETKTKIFAIEILKLFKQEYSYNELSSFIQLPIPVLSRYINGHVLPNIKRAKNIIDKFEKRYLIDILMRKIRFEKTGAFDHSDILSNADLLEKIAKMVFQDFNFVKVDKILTVETDGIPLAIQTGKEFGVNTIIAKRNKEMGIEDFIEVKRVYLTGTYGYLYIPKNSIKKGEFVLLVDDVIRTGSTMEALMNMCKKANANVAGIFTIISVGDSIKKLKKRLTCPVNSLIEIE
ncbi:MAG: phosphoribosyltransferase family protein [Candidatus Aenigmarchaeota archaeon]|nr:phosphoribosyltransferase family protein [Candidatus Aenigmarchaeota archaeon]